MSSAEPGSSSEFDEADRLREEVARLRVEVWELRDALQGRESLERSNAFLVHENHRLMGLVRRPWRAWGFRLRSVLSRIRRRWVGLRSPN